MFVSQLSEIKRRSWEWKRNCCCSSKHCLPRNWNRQKSSIIYLRGKRYFGGLFAFQCLYFLETNKHRRRVNQSSGRMNLSAKHWLLLGSFYASSLLIRDCITTKMFRCSDCVPLVKSHSIECSPISALVNAIAISALVNAIAISALVNAIAISALVNAVAISALVNVLLSVHWWMFSYQCIGECSPISALVNVLLSVHWWMPSLSVHWWMFSYQCIGECSPISALVNAVAISALVNVLLSVHWWMFSYQCIGECRRYQCIGECSPISALVNAVAISALVNAKQRHSNSEFTRS